MPWSQAEYDALKAAIARGTQTVSYNGRSVTYHSLKDMRALLAEMERDLAGTSAQPYRLASTSKGA
jgi:hypothetical protein